MAIEWLTVSLVSTSVTESSRRVISVVLPSLVASWIDSEIPADDAASWELYREYCEKWLSSTITRYCAQCIKTSPWLTRPLGRSDMHMLRSSTSRTAPMRILIEVKYGAVEDVCSALKEHGCHLDHTLKIGDNLRFSDFIESFLSRVMSVTSRLISQHWRQLVYRRLGLKLSWWLWIV